MAWRKGKPISPETRAKMRSPDLRHLTAEQYADFRLFKRNGCARAEALHLATTALL